MPSLTSSLPFSPAELAYLHTSLSSTPTIRPDTRQETDFRPLRAETGVLPSVHGSAHVGFSDGREAIVGVKLEVEKTAGAKRWQQQVDEDADDGGMDMDDVDSESSKNKKKDRHETKRQKGKKEWVTLSLTLPGLRDDDANLFFLEEMLREPLLVSPSPSAPSLQDNLVINSRWHWHVYIDVVLISPTGLASYPLPLLSMAVHMALRDTRVPKLKSEGEEDPVADDDWMASTYLYTRDKSSSSNASPKPPITLLVIVVGGNATYDPSREELAVADGIIAVSVGSTGTTTTTMGSTSTQHGGDNDNGNGFQILATRMIDPPARDTMKGVPMTGEVPEGVEAPGVWRPRIGGIERKLLKMAVNSVIGAGVARDVMRGLDGFLDVEASTNPGGGAVDVGAG